ncbi:MAG: baseplate J/gp47 family protein [Pseudomonadota bacterium]
MSTQRSLQELIDRAKATLISKTGENNPAIEAIASAIAGVSYGQYGYQDQLFRELHPETCSEPWLYLHAARHDAERLQPTFAKGQVTFTELGGTVVIPKGTELTDQAGNEYETERQQYSNENVDVIALESGTSSNLPAGAGLTLKEGLGGIDPNDVQSLGISGGADLEALEHWRDRVVTNFKRNIQVGKREDYQAWAVSAHADVDFAWVLDNTPVVGRLEVYIGSRADDPSVTPEVVSIVQNEFEQRRLAGCFPTAKLPEQMPLDIEIQGIEDQSIRDNVITALQEFIMDKMGVIDEVTKKPESITPTELILKISEVTTNFIVVSPTQEVTIENTQIHTLGIVTWTPPS